MMCRWGDAVDCDVIIPAAYSCTRHERQARKAIDRCIAPLVNALNTAGPQTVASCCGHGRREGEIVLRDGRTLVVRLAEGK